MVKTPFKETEYKGWCSANGVTPGDGDNRYMEFLRQRNYETWDIDPPEYPGINAACGWIRGQGLKYGRHYEALSEHHREWIREMMNKKYANDCMTGQFEIEDKLDKLGKGKGVLKLLPTEAMNPGYAVREIDIIARLDHENIVKLQQGQVPLHRHDTPWIVTEFCDKKTLQDVIRSHRQKKQLVPELFAWQVFASLARAVSHCHNGDPMNSFWDEITHRDIILNNIFIKTNERSQRYEYPLTVKLGDWGCGVTQSEWNSCSLTLDDLPVADYDYDTPENANPSQATDVYQIGVVMCCLLCLREMPGLDLDALERHQRWPGCHYSYSQDIRDLIIACIKEDPEKRPSANMLAIFVQQRCANLIAKGRLAKEPFEFGG